MLHRFVTTFYTLRSSVNHLEYQKMFIENIYLSFYEDIFFLYKNDLLHAIVFVLNSLCELFQAEMSVYPVKAFKAFPKSTKPSYVFLSIKSFS